MGGSAVELAILLTAKDMASGVLEKVNGKVSGLGAAGRAAVAGITALSGAAIGGITTAIGLANATAEAAMQVRLLARETGLSAEAASEMRFSAEKLGISTETLSKSFGIFSKNLELHGDAMKKLGVEVVRTKDGHVDLQQTVLRLSDVFKGMPDGVEKTALSLELFGRGGKEMLPFLNQGIAGLEVLGQEAADTGLVFSQQGVDSAFKYGQAQKALAEQFEALRNKIGLAVMPALTQLFTFLTSAAETILPPFISVVTQIWTILGEVFDVITGRAPDAGGAMKDALGPDAANAIMGAVAGIRDVVQALIGTLGDFIGWLNSTDDVAVIMREVLSVLGTVIGTVLHAAIVVVTTAFHSMADQIRGIGPVFTELHKVAESFGSFFVGLWEGLSGPVQAAINTLTGPIQGLINIIQTALGWLAQLGAAQASTPLNAQGVPSGYENTPGFGQYQEGTPYVPYTGLFKLHQGEAVIPANRNLGGWGGGGTTINIYADVVDAQALDRFANRIGASQMRGARLAGGRV